MICFIALIVFGILGIFSVSYRKIAAEALDCVFRRVTFRKCESRLDQRLKSQITGKMMKRNMKLASLTFRYFEVISWFFTILLIASFAYSAYSLYNLAAYGNCNGPTDNGLCIFDPTGKYGEVTECTSEVEGNGHLTISDVNLSLFPTYTKTGKNQLVYLGCYLCDNTRKVNPVINKIVTENDVDFTFIHVPVVSRDNYMSLYSNCIYGQDHDAFWQFHNQLMNSDKEIVENDALVRDLVKKLGIDEEEFEACIDSDEAQALFHQQMEEIYKTGIQGTPTVFVNGEPLTGVRPTRAYEGQLK